jgi:hypothetical protein
MIAFAAVITALPAKHVDEEAKRIMQTTKYMCCSLDRHADPLYCKSFVESARY